MVKHETSALEFRAKRLLLKRLFGYDGSGSGNDIDTTLELLLDDFVGCLGKDAYKDFRMAIMTKNTPTIGRLVLKAAENAAARYVDSPAANSVIASIVLDLAEK